MFLLTQTRSLHQPKPMRTSTGIILIITKTTMTITTSTAIAVKTKTITTTTTKIKRTLIALMKRQFTTKIYKRNCRKFDRINIQIF